MLARQHRCTVKVSSADHLHQDPVSDIDQVEIGFMVYESCLLARHYLSEVVDHGVCTVCSSSSGVVVQEMQVTRLTMTTFLQ